MRHRLANLTPPIQRPLKPVRIRLEVHHGLIDAFARRLHERAVLHDLLIQWLACDEHEVRILGAAFFDGCSDAVAHLLEHDVVVRRDRLVGFRRAVAETHDSGQRIRERVPVLGQLLREASAGPDRDVEDPYGRVREVADRIDAVAAARNHLDLHPAVVDRHGGDLLRS